MAQMSQERFDEIFGVAAILMIQSKKDGDIPPFALRTALKKIGATREEYQEFLRALCSGRRLSVKIGFE